MAQELPSPYRSTSKTPSDWDVPPTLLAGALVVGGLLWLAMILYQIKTAVDILLGRFI